MPLLPLPALALVLSAHIPSADPPALGTQRVAILRLRFAGKIPEGLQDLFAERLAQGLTAARLEVMPGPDVASRLASAPEDVAACQSPACYPALGALLEASYLITAQVSESNKTYTMVLDIINGQTGGVLASSHERCETCGAEEAGEKMGLAASALRERLEVEASAPAHVLIRSRPSGATVVVDGQPSGVTPLAAELTAGNISCSSSCATTPRLPVPSPRWPGRGIGGANAPCPPCPPASPSAPRVGQPWAVALPAARRHRYHELRPRPGRLLLRQLLPGTLSAGVGHQVVGRRHDWRRRRRGHRRGHHGLSGARPRGRGGQAGGAFLSERHIFERKPSGCRGRGRDLGASARFRAAPRRFARGGDRERVARRGKKTPIARVAICASAARLATSTVTAA